MEETPTSLDDDVDWMTYDHSRLHQMVTEDMNLGAASGVAERWRALGAVLDELGDDLRRIVTMSAAAWEGVAAEKARGSMSTLVHWSHRTGAAATEVSDALTAEVANAQRAKQAMPEPVPLTKMPMIEPFVRNDTGQGGTVPSGARPLQPFHGTDADTARFVPEDQYDVAEERRQRHREAAEVMRTFQRDSRQVYGTVPTFAQPGNPTRLDPSRKPPGDGGERKRPPNPGGTAPTGSAPEQATGARAESPAGGAGRGAANAPAAPGQVVSGVPPAGAGGQVGVGRGQEPTPASGSGSSAAPARGASGVGAMPMGGAGARGDDDQERRSSLLQSDDNLFGDLPKVAPPVLGEDRSDA